MIMIETFRAFFGRFGVVLAVVTPFFVKNS